MSTKDSGSTRIEPLKEENFGSWFVDIRAELRSKKLWKYTQETYESEDSGTATTAGEGETPQISKKEQRAIKDWEEKSQEAADLITPTINTQGASTQQSGQSPQRSTTSQLETLSIYIYSQIDSEPATMAIKLDLFIEQVDI